MSYTLRYTGSDIDTILGRAAPGGQLDTDIAAKAPLASPALTGDPTAPTQEEGDGSTKLATTEYADRAAASASVALLPTESVTPSSIASFPDGADDIPVKSAAFSILPVQSGSGDPAPDNVRPISGWNGANITRAGRNLFSPHPNHNVNAQGEYIEAGAQNWATDYIPIGDTKSVVVSVADLGGMTDGSIVRVEYASNGAVTSTTIGYFNSYSTPWTFTLADNIVGLRFRGYRSGGASPITGAKIQAEFGSSATTYEAYNGDTILLTFGSTVYAGTLTALGGGLWKIQPTHGIVTLTGAEDYTWSKSGTYSGSFYRGAQYFGFKRKDDGGTLQCSHLGYVANISDYAIGKCLLDGSVNLRFADGTTLPDVTAFKAYLAAQYSAGTPVQVIGDLATLPDPIIIDAEDLVTVLGNNNIWADCGDVTELTYRADLALYIQRVVNGDISTLSTLSLSPSPTLTLGRLGETLAPAAELVALTEDAESAVTDEDAATESAEPEADALADTAEPEAADAAAEAETGEEA